MKKNHFIVLGTMVILITSLLLAGCNGVSLNAYKNNEFVYEDFICQMGADRNAVNIAALSEVGKRKEVIIIPSEIHGKPVTELADRANYYVAGSFNSDCLKRIYYLSYISTFKEMFSGNAAVKNAEGSPNLEKIFIIRPKFVGESWHDIMFIDDAGERNHLEKTVTVRDGQYEYLLESPHCCYISRFHYETYFDKDVGITSFQGDRYMINTCIANTTFYYNFEGSENDGIYWIDDYAYGDKIIYLPENPVREGYIFNGWYKESDCINLWNFDEDTLPNAFRNEYGNLIYQETVLYAKWSTDYVTKGE